MILLSGFQQYISHHNLFTKDHHLLLAVSGGVDSAVLVHLCHQAGYKFSIAHCNFQLRGEESERDEAFVKSLAEQYKVKVFVQKFNTNEFALENKLSIQEAARQLRYKWFDELLSTASYQLSTLLTAHHLDDSIETSTMHFFRGTGISGLRGMLPKQGAIVRPLLFVSKQAILDFAKGKQLQWVEDSSNESSKYTRNFFRNELLPMIEQVYPEVKQNLARNLQRFAETEELYLQAVQLYKKKLLEQKGGEIHIPVLKLKKCVPLYSIVYEIIKDFHFTAAQTDDLISLLDAENSKYVQSSTHRIIKNRNWLIIAPLESSTAENILIDADLDTVEYSGGKIEIKKLSIINYQLSSSSSIATLDAEKIEFPLLLRKWKTGDYFYPLGMKKKKKVARFLIDQKLSKTGKENSWVLESNQKILWIVAQRIDDRFKILPSTKHILQISFTTPSVD
jgi:tRNA(Ile)-lysidine synthase